MTMVEIGNEELVPRIEKAIATLKELREGQENEDERGRLDSKIEGLEFILSTQGERFQHMRTQEDAVALASMVAMNAYPWHGAAVKLVQGYLMEYCGA